MDADALENLIDDYCMHDCPDGCDEVCPECHIRLFMDKMAERGLLEPK